MQVRMKMQILAPGVEHSQEADGSAQQFRIGRCFQQYLGSRVEQDGIDLSRVLKRKLADLPGRVNTT